MRPHNRRIRGTKDRTMLATLLEKVTGRQRQRQTERAKTYGDLVRQVAAEGPEPDADDVDRILDTANKSAEDLAADVARVQSRQTLKSQYDSTPRIQADLNRLSAERNEAEANYKTAREELDRKHVAALDGFDWRRIALNQEMAVATEARQSLAKSSPVYPKYETAMQRVGLAKQSLAALQKEYSHIAANLESTRVKMAKDQIERIESRLSQMQSELSALQATVNAADAEAKRLEAELYKV